MRRISTSALIPGMVTAEDVFSYNNTLILPKGLILTDKAITKLEFYSVFNIKVEDHVVETNENIETFGPSFSKRLKNTEEFRKYSETFIKQTSALRNTIDDLMEHNGAISEDELYALTKDLVPTGGKYVNVFDMLHNMRENDDVTYTHSMNVALISNVLARWLRMTPSEIRIATLCGMLHDIGKTRLPNTILKKRGKLTRQEYDVVKTHPTEGYQTLMPLMINDHVKNAVLMHHERLDGSGYPLGISGNRVDHFAQLVAIADVYDAMTCARVYRGPLCPFKAVSLFESEGYQKYNPRYFLTFLENIADTYLQYTVRLSNGQEGDIVYINPGRLSRPVVKIGENYIDLSRELNLEIECII